MIRNFTDFLQEARSIQDLPARDERPMVQGIVQILKGVRDLENRRELAEEQVRGFQREGIRFDYAEFFRLCGLKAPDK